MNNRYVHFKQTQLFLSFYSDFKEVIMSSVICAIVGGRTHFAYREKRLTAHLDNTSYYYEIKEYVSDINGYEPIWLRKIFETLGIDVSSFDNLRDKVILRSEPQTNFVRATYEITERCNYKCLHCYLGDKDAKEISLDEKFQMLSVLEKAGVLILQISGGEILCSKDFLEFYSKAYEMGFVIQLMTNGSLLYKDKYMDEFLHNPPHSFTISIYGASEETYEGMTQVSGSYMQFKKSLDRLHEEGIRAVCSIIITKNNKHELDEMIAMATERGLDYKVYDNIVPGLDGSTEMLDLNISEKLSIAEDRVFTEDHSLSSNHFNCKAGMTFLHINSNGTVSLCKTDREPQIPILEVPLEEVVNGLKSYAEKALLLASTCLSCKVSKDCKHCPPMLKLYKNANAVEMLCKTACN